MEAVPEIPSWVDDVPPIEYDVPLGDPEPPHFCFPGVWLDDTTVNLNSEYLIKGVINYGDYVVVYGPSGDGKTFFTIDLALHIASGTPWRGKRVKQFMVVYVAAEAGHSIERRFAAARDAKQLKYNTPLMYLPTGPNLMDEVESAELISDLSKLKNIALQRGTRLGLVVFDTLARSMPGGDENSAQDMGKIVEIGNRIRKETGAATLIVHHSGKDTSKGARGNSALRSGADAEIAVIQKVAKVEKSRDGSGMGEYPFNLKVVELGMDNDGDLVTTCIVETSDQPALQKAKGPTGTNQKVVFDVLRELIVLQGKPMPGTSALPAGIRAVNTEVLFKIAIDKFPGIEGFRARAKISDALLRMQAAELVGVHGDYVWIWNK